ncbi:MAG: hypothetical protein L6U99_11790 [Clostridium sp.]|nr:MAG: hypothetical protein L6U99_11790 [Clostridium sp.]
MQKYFFEDNQKNTIKMVKDHIDDINVMHVYGAGIRIFKGKMLRFMAILMKLMSKA